MTNNLDKPRNQARAVVTGLILLAAGVGAQMACDRRGHGPQGKGEGDAPLPVGVLTVHPQMLPLSFESVGQAEGSREVEVRARVSGLLEQRVYEEGQKLKAGSPMFRIQRAQYEIVLQQARANLMQQQAQLDRARREANRLKPLAANKAVPQRDYDEAVSATALAEAAVVAAQAGVRDAELNLSYTTVTAPISGISGRSVKSQGNLISAGSDSLLTTITQADPIWVRFTLSEQEASRVRKTSRNEIRLVSSDGAIQLNGGRVNFAASTVDAKTGMVQFRAEFPNHELAVLPGQFVRVQVLSAPMAAYKVPKSTVAQNEQGRTVWVAQAGKAQMVPVVTGAWVGSDWVIQEGLKDGDQVIIDNLMKLAPEMPVAPQPTPSANQTAVQ